MRFQRYLGIRPHEARTVWLFFLHHFLIGIGTIQVYVAANTILLENEPETSLPFAYMASALILVLAGKVYAHFEHHLGLGNLSVRILWTVALLTAMVILLVWLGHSVAAAISIMVGYRLIYLLTSLEFWGVSAVVFDTRQGKRLFSVISSGDMPAKALGAVLTALVHAHADLITLLFISLLAFLGSLYSLNRIVRSHAVEVRGEHTHHGREASRWLRKLFGGSELVFFLSLGIVAIAVFMARVEFSFFMDVKHRFHDQADVIKYVSFLLAATYLVAMIGKLIFSGRALDRLGVRRSLLLLPAVAVPGLIIAAYARTEGVPEARMMAISCGLYLVLEVLRKTLFDPVFLVLFQPLSPHQRLQGHTLVKALYEPLGLGFAGLLLWLTAHSDGVISWIWVAFPVAALALYRKAYVFYMHTLREALALRFLAGEQVAFPSELKTAVHRDFQSQKPERVLTAVDWLLHQDPGYLQRKGPELLVKNASQPVRLRLLDVLTAIPDETLNILLSDSDNRVKEKAAECLARTENRMRTEVLLTEGEPPVRRGAIRGALQKNPDDALAKRSLEQFARSAEPAERIVALGILGGQKGYSEFIERSLSDEDGAVRTAAIEAAGSSANPLYAASLAPLLGHPTLGRAGLAGLRQIGEGSLPAAIGRWTPEASASFRIALARLCGSVRSPESRQVLVKLVADPDRNVREAALWALGHLARETEGQASFVTLLDEEMELAGFLQESTGRISGAEWQNTIRYELERIQKRVLSLLSLLHDPETITNARLGLTHPSRERRANSLEILENLVSRPVYLFLRDLAEPSMRPVTDDFNGRAALIRRILTDGRTIFSDWTVSVALRHWTPDAGEPALFIRYTDAPDALLREGAARAALLLRDQACQLFRELEASHPQLTTMSHAVASETISPAEMVWMLKNTPLFASTPENVLASIIPILKVTEIREGGNVFRKGDPGDSLFVVFSGEVGIYDNDVLLAEMGKGELFGELALLDAEPRSATVTALSDATLFRLNQDDFYDLMEERPEVLRNIMRVLCGRIRKQNDALTGSASERVE